MRFEKWLKGTAVLALAAGIAAPAFADDGFTSGDAKHGEKVFKLCKACHTAEEGGPNRVGPNLYGIFKRGVATHEGYKYSDAMKKFGEEHKEWTPDVMFVYLKSPQKDVPGTFMSFPGLKKEKDRNDLITYLIQETGGLPNE